MAKADARQIDVLDAVGSNQDTRRLALQVDAGALPEAKRAQVAVEPVAPQPQRQLREDRVAGVLERLLHALRAVGIAPAAHGASVHGDLAGAVKTLVGVGGPAVDRGGRRQNLEGRTRLIDVANGGDAHEARQRPDVLARRVIRVIGRIHRHGAHRTGVHVHGDRLYILGFIDLRAFAHGPLDSRLDLAVDGQPERVARLCGHIERDAVGQRARPGVHLGHDAARLAGKHVVIDELQPALPLAVHVAQAQHLREHIAHRVPAADVLVKGEPGELRTVGIRAVSPDGAQPVRVLAGDLAHERHAGGVLLGEPPHDRVRVGAQLTHEHLAQPLGVGDLARAGAEDEAGHRLREHAAFRIDDAAAPCGDDAAAGPLGDAALREHLGLRDLQIAQPRNHAKKEEKESAHQQNQPLSYGGSR